VEYNLINSIPILYPNQNQHVNIQYAPRYIIADAYRILHCFDKGKKLVTIQNTDFRFIRISLDISFQTCNNEIKALYYYIMVNNTIDFDGLDYKNYNKVLRWLRSVDNHYVIVSTPILYYKHTYYSIANDNEINIIEHTANELMDDAKMLMKLVRNNCYTICDTFNIIIALFQQQCINKQQFIIFIKLHNQTRNFCYTHAVWLYLINHHRIFCAYDFPLLCLSTTPYLIDDSILMHYQINHNLYLQTCHNDNILFTTLISLSYPHTNINYLKLILGNICDNLWFNTANLSLSSKDSLIVNDFFALFATFVYKNCMWKFWCKNKNILLSKLLKSYNENNCLLFDILCPLFRLYIYGYEGIKIRKSRIRQIWLDVLHLVPIMKDILIQFIVLNKIDIPYIFLMDVFRQNTVNFTIENIITFPNAVVKRYSIYQLLDSRTSLDTVYYFHKNVLKKRILIALMCIYKKFGLFNNQQVTLESYQQGMIILNFLQNNRHYLL
jgi:hypothetical protein